MDAVTKRIIDLTGYISDGISKALELFRVHEAEDIYILLLAKD